MAQPTGPPPAQQQQQQHIDPYNSMSGMLNLVLISIGRILRDSSKLGTKNTTPTNLRVRYVIPRALNRFHDALDDVETEIIRAKATMERDLALCRARRAEREREAAAEKERLTAQAVIKDEEPEPTSKPEDTVMEDVSQNEPSTTQAQQQEDTVMGEATDGETKVKEEAPQSSNQPEIKPPEMKDSSQSIEAAPPRNAPEPAKAELTENANPKNEAPVKGEASAPAAQLASTATENTAAAPAQEDTNIKDINFGSMFGDAENEPPHNDEHDLNFDIDFSTGGPAGGDDNNLFNDDLFGADMDKSEDKPGEAANDDVTSLLPGLENYANATDNFNFLDPNAAQGQAQGQSQPQDQQTSSNPASATASAAAQPSQDATAPSAVGPSDQETNAADMPPDLLPPDSTFDDLFVNSDFNFDDNGGSGNAEGGENFDDAFWMLEGS